jgi:hypothetical protein
MEAFLRGLCRPPWPHVLLLVAFFALWHYWALSRSTQRFCQIVGNYVAIEGHKYRGGDSPRSQVEMEQYIQRTLTLLKDQTPEGQDYRLFLQLESAWERFCVPSDSPPSDD